MQLIWSLNMLLAFIVEVIAVISYGYFGVQLASTRVMQIISAIISIGVIVVIWGAFFAPKATHPWPEPWLYLGKFFILMMPSYIWYLRGNMSLAITWFVLILVHLILLYLQPKSPFT